MSVILDALRRRRIVGEPQVADSANADRVLTTLVYPPAAVRHDKPASRKLVVYGGGAIVIGLAGLVLLAMFLTPASPPPRPNGSAMVAKPAIQTTRASEAPLTPLLAQTPASRGTDTLVQRAPEPVARPTTRVAMRSPVRRSTPSAATTAPTTPAPPVARAVTPPPVDYFALALSYQRLGDVDNAVAHYRTLIDANNATPEVHNNLGLLYDGRGQSDEAVRQFRQALTIDPKHAAAHNNLGVALLRSGKLDEARAEFQMVLAQEPRNVESIVNLALVERAAGRMADARTLLQRAVAVDSRNAGAHYNLALVADQLGQTTIAIEHYRAFLRLGAVPYRDLAAQVRTRVSLLGG